ncbi:MULTISPECIES: hypothetical protein [Streptomyces]|uniref:Uncharacterized protein n=1 Tax=Streptomyces melanosporofaciens TaxID=67327 RepID=A0A1H5CFB9_STRMJ|nr:hypothetical protein [Streptomyces melanosporofaciens]SED65479.1 hypothetical protein SAMN04490356_9390 [Streptomyces melanosporofaciens]
MTDADRTRLEVPPEGLKAFIQPRPEMRTAAHGFAAGCGKLGAALGTFLFPVLLSTVGKAHCCSGMSRAAPGRP